jgi:3-deoxy-manno-octulosonate cytidylyltransferase (CMP-KDO synthetase)
MNKKVKVIGIIPARYKSSRFPGKPIADIHGKPMIWHVYQRAKKAKLLDEIYVATDDQRIKEVCDSFNMQVIMTSDTHTTGSDRLSECASRINADFYVNIQGDEPMIDSNSIDSVAQEILIEENENIVASGAFMPINDPSDIIDSNVVKVIISNSGVAISYSRSPIPYPKDGKAHYYKQLGLYAFKKEGLDIFANNTPSSLESTEGVELFRLLENDKHTKMVEIFHKTISVDTPRDLERVRLLMATSKY